MLFIGKFRGFTIQILPALLYADETVVSIGGPRKFQLY